MGTRDFHNYIQNTDDAFDDESPANADQPAPPCGPGGNALDNGSWHVYDLETGVEQVMVDYAGGFTGAGGFSELWMTFYQYGVSQ